MEIKFKFEVIVLILDLNWFVRQGLVNFLHFSIWTANFWVTDSAVDGPLVIHRRRLSYVIRVATWMSSSQITPGYSALRKHAYSNIYRKFHLQSENFQIKNSDIFYISVQNIDCGYSLEPPRRGGSNEYPLPMFSSRNKKNNVYPCKPQFYYIKVEFKGVKII